MLAAIGVLALTGCQDQQAGQGSDAAPPTSKAAEQPRSKAPATQAPVTRPTTAPRPTATSDGDTPRDGDAPPATATTSGSRIAWSKEDLAQQLRTARRLPDSTSVTCPVGLPAKEGATTTCTAVGDDGPELYAAVVKPAGVTGAMAPKFVKVSRDQ